MLSEPEKPQQTWKNIVGKETLKFVMANRNVSEEGAYRRIANFAKSRIEGDAEKAKVDEMVQNDRLRLLRLIAAMIGAGNLDWIEEI